MIGEKNCGKRLDSEVAAMLVLGTYLFHAYLYLLKEVSQAYQNLWVQKANKPRYERNFLQQLNHHGSIIIDEQLKIQEDAFFSCDLNVWRHFTKRY